MDSEVKRLMKQYQLGEIEYEEYEARLMRYGEFIMCNEPFKYALDGDYNGIRCFCTLVKGHIGPHKTPPLARDHDKVTFAEWENGEGPPDPWKPVLIKNWPI